MPAQKITTLSDAEAQASATCLDSFFLDAETLVLEMKTEDWLAFASQLDEVIRITVNDLSNIGNDGEVEITLTKTVTGARS